MLKRTVLNVERVATALFGAFVLCGATAARFAIAMRLSESSLECDLAFRW